MGTLLKALPAKALVLNRKNIPVLLLTITYMVVGLYGLRDYLEWRSVNLIIGLATMPLMCSVKGQGTGYRRFAIFALLYLAIGFLAPVKTMVYLAFACILLFTIESNGRKLSWLPFLAFCLMSPICQYVAQVFSFPIRLWLSKVAGSLLQQADPTVSVAGNVIAMGKTEFSVDPACMGLNMLVTSLLCGLIMLAVYQKQMQLILKPYWLMLSLLAIFVFNIVANLFRILLLVYFALMPGTMMHEIIGIICLLLYVILPGALLIKWIVNTFGKVPKPAMAAVNRQMASVSYFHFLLLPVFVWLCVNTGSKSSGSPAAAALPAVPGYHVSWSGNEVIKMENELALVYIKPLKGFVYSDHNPLICWTGSGYQFRQVEEQRWSGIPVFTGVLTKGAEQLYTAWWYDNGATATVSQWDWRSRMLRGEPAFCIINITAGDLAGLKSQLAALVAHRQTILMGLH